MKQEQLQRPSADQIAKEIRRQEMAMETRKAVKAAVGSLLVFAAAAVLVSMLWFPVYQMNQGSMEPTLREGDLLIFSALGRVGRGDIIAFHYNNQVLIKRVIALGGETIDFTDEGNVTINGAPFDEPYLIASFIGDCTIELPYMVPFEQFFVMGDNRLVSSDSRAAAIGSVGDKQIVGKALVRVWPIPRAGRVR